MKPYEHQKIEILQRVNKISVHVNNCDDDDGDGDAKRSECEKYN
jgi:hypothetical protein